MTPDLPDTNQAPAGEPRGKTRDTSNVAARWNIGEIAGTLVGVAIFCLIIAAVGGMLYSIPTQPAIANLLSTPINQWSLERYLWEH